MKAFFKALAAACLLWACAGPERVQAPVSTAAPTPAQEESSVQDMLARVKDAYARGDYAKGLELVKEVLNSRSDSLSSYDRIGSMYFALGREAEALTIWERALQMEKDAQRRKALGDTIAMTRRSLGLGEAPPEPVPAKPVPKPVAKPAPPIRKADPAELEKLHARGVELYAGGEYLQASAVYLKILELDPDDARAKKALERLRTRR